MVKGPVGSPSGGTFACGLRQCRILSDSRWQSRQEEKVAAGHQIWGTAKDQNAWKALITYLRPLAKPDAAFGTCLCGET